MSENVNKTEKFLKEFEEKNSENIKKLFADELDEINARYKRERDKSRKDFIRDIRIMIFLFFVILVSYIYYIIKIN